MFDLGGERHVIVQHPCMVTANRQTEKTEQRKQTERKTQRTKNQNTGMKDTQTVTYTHTHTHTQTDRQTAGKHAPIRNDSITGAIFNTTVSCTPI